MKISQNFYFYSAVIFAFILPLSRAMISTFVVILPLIWLLDGSLRQKYEEIKANPLLLSIALFIIYMCVSLLWSLDVAEGLNTARLYMYWLVIFVFATRLHKDHAKHIISAFLFGMMISEIFAYGVFFELWTAKYATKEYLSPFMMHIDYSVFLAFTSVLLLSRILSKEYSMKQKIAFSIFFCTVTGNLFLAPGRTGQVAFILGVFAVFFYHYEFKIKTIIKAVITIGLVMILAYNISSVFQQRITDLQKDLTMLQSGDYNGSWGTRVAFILTGIEIFKNNPIFGTGLGGSINGAHEVFESHQINFDASVESFITNNHFHNQFLMTLVETGMIGIILILNMIAQIIKFSSRTLKMESKEIMVIFLVVYLFSCIAEPLWMKQFTIGLWSLIIGIFVV